MTFVFLICCILMAGMIDESVKVFPTHVKTRMTCVKECLTCVKECLTCVKECLTCVRNNRSARPKYKWGAIRPGEGRSVGDLGGVGFQDVVGVGGPDGLPVQPVPVVDEDA